MAAAESWMLSRSVAKVNLMARHSNRAALAGAGPRPRFTMARPEGANLGVSAHSVDDRD